MKIKSKITGQPVTLFEEHQLALAEAEDCERDGAWAEEAGWSNYAKRINPERIIYSKFVPEHITLDKEFSIVESILSHWPSPRAKKIYGSYLNSLID